MLTHENIVRFAVRARASEFVMPDPEIAEASPGAVIRARRKIGAAIPTGIPTLDRRLGGGLPPGRSIVFGAPPGLGKTALVIQILTDIARRGSASVWGLFADEGPGGAAIRVGQNLGLDRAKLEAGDETTAAALEEKLSGCTLLFPDPDAAEMTVEGVAELARSRTPKGGPIVIGIDSIQTVRSSAAEDERDVRVSVKKTATAIRGLAKRLDIAVIAASEVNRSGYRATDENERANPLSTFSESSRIEYAFDVVVVIDGDPESEIRLRIVKNRLGLKGEPFYLRFDRARACFAEVDSVERARSHDLEKASTARQKLDDVKAEVRKRLRAHQEGLTTTELRIFSGVRKALVRDALGALESDDEIESRRTPGRGCGLRWFLIGGDEASDGLPEAAEGHRDERETSRRGRGKKA